MKKQIMMCLVVLIILMVLFTGCIENDGSDDAANSLIGTWKAVDDEFYYRMYVFNEDGTCLVNTYGLPATYKLQNDTITVTYTDNHQQYVYSYTLSNNNNRLILRDEELGEIVVYERQT